jgi:hypothetical protein
MNKKYQVFVSSTFKDLQEERSAVIRIVLEMNHLPAGMELFPAADLDQMKYIKKVIDECDYYILIIGGRYGSIDSDGISYTEKEFDYAVESGKVVLAFLHEKPEYLPVIKSDENADVRAELTRFREKVTHSRLIKYWNTRDELEKNVMKSLMFAFNEMPQTGWIRGDVVPSDEIILNNAELIQENMRLKGALGKGGKDSDALVELERNMAKTMQINFAYRGVGGKKRSSHKFQLKSVFERMVQTIDTYSISDSVRVSLMSILIEQSINEPELPASKIKDLIYLFEYYGLVRSKTLMRYELTPKGMGYYAETCLQDSLQDADPA